MTPRLAAKAAIALVLAAGWAAAAWALWPTEVPGDLDLPNLDERDYFGAGIVHDAAGFENGLRWIFVGSQATLLAVLAVYAWQGARFARESAAGRIGTGMLLAMLGLGIVWIFQVPAGALELWWYRRHDVLDTGYVEWLAGEWFVLGIEFLFVCLAILVVMGLAGPLRDRWWVLGGPAFAGIALLFAFLSPYLVVDTHPIDDPQLAADARELARKEGVPGTRVEVEEVSDVTSAPNAFATGFGPTKAVFLWDTLVDKFPRDEVRVVLAHELGHVSRNHILKSVAWYALFAVPGAYLIALTTRRRGGMREPQAVPLSLFVLVVLNLVALPAQNVLSRRLEAEADWVALQTTRDPDAARNLFERFTNESLAEPDPPTWSFLLLDSHPTVMQRIAMVEAWEERTGSAGEERESP